MQGGNTASILAVEKLKVHFPVGGGLFSKPEGYIKAVDGVSFAIARGETLGLVGESGCGKTTIGRVILRLQKATEGRVFFNDKEILGLRGPELRALRKNIQVIYQDPYSSLNPRMTVGEIVGEPLLVAGGVSRRDIPGRVSKLLDSVGLSAYHARRYPHEFSGGQRQRVGIARALALQPELIVCDEPVSALDVSIQAQVLNLFADLKAEFGLTYLFIAHGMATVKHISDRVAVMYLGKIVELADKETIYADPLHPYTRALMASIPLPDPERAKGEVPLMGEIPSPMNPPAGCRFHPRCPLAQPICSDEEPEFVDKGNGHLSACHFS